MKKLDELEQDEILSPVFEVEGFVGESFSSSFEFSIDNENLANFNIKVQNEGSPINIDVELGDISEITEKMNTAWDEIIGSLNSAEDWENLTPEIWESMLDSPVLF